MLLVDRLVYLIIRLVICLVQAFSLESCHTAAIILSIIFNDLLRVRRRLLLENLQKAFPNLSLKERCRLGRKMWLHLFLMAVEVAHAPRQINAFNWYKMVRINRSERMLKAIHQDRPLILVTAHFGNFEMGGYLLGLLGCPTFAVARSLDNPFLNNYIQNFREMTGQFLISKNEGYEEILEILRNKGTIAFLADQAAGPKGVWIDFFGHKASAYKAMALLSMQYDAPILICYATRMKNHPMHFNMRELGLFDPRDSNNRISGVRDITQWFTNVLENAIREDPDQYWWIHNRWKTYGRVFPPAKQN